MSDFWITISFGAIGFVLLRWWEYEARIKALEGALQDMSKHVWRNDWSQLKPETRALLDEKK